MAEQLNLTQEQMIEYAQKGIEASLEGGTYVALDLHLESLQKLGVNTNPIQVLDLRIQSREKYAQVASPEEMLLNEGFEDELKQLKREWEELKEQPR